MENIEKILTNNPFWIYVGSPNLWQNLPPARGIDIVDFIHEKRQDDKLNNEQLKEVIMGMLGEKKEFGQDSGKDNLVKFPKLPPNSAFQSIDKLLELNLSRSEIIKKIPDIVAKTDVKEITIS